jgi:hypothetical protein
MHSVVAMTRYSGLLENLKLVDQQYRMRVGSIQTLRSSRLALFDKRGRKQAAWHTTEST